MYIYVSKHNFFYELKVPIREIFALRSGNLKGPEHDLFL